jgi:hypothetical protein
VEPPSLVMRYKHWYILKAFLFAIVINRSKGWYDPRQITVRHARSVHGRRQLDPSRPAGLQLGDAVRPRGGRGCHGPPMTAATRRRPRAGRYQTTRGICNFFLGVSSFLVPNRRPAGKGTRVCADGRGRECDPVEADTRKLLTTPKKLQIPTPVWYRADGDGTGRVGRRGSAT